MIARDHHNSASEPTLADTLALLMPSAPTTRLLQATLGQGAAVHSAWTQWRQTIPDPKAFLASDRVGIKRHLPLLYRTLVANQVDIGRDLEPYFRAARAREELRSARYRQFLAESLAALRSAGIDFVVGKGVTVGETVHPDPVLRHSHDIDLLVPASQMSAAAAALQSAGFSPSAERKFDHASGLPVELHDRLYRTPFYNGDLAGPWARACPAEVAGIPVRRLADIDLLVHSPVHASLVPQRRGLSWIVDTVTLLNHRAAQGVEMDWPAIAQLAGEIGAALPMFVACRYLAGTFAAPIPPDAIAQLHRTAQAAGPLQHLAALDGLRADVRTRALGPILWASNWRSRWAIARALSFPPAEYLRAEHPGLGRLPLAMLYFRRPLRLAGRWARRSRNRLAGFLRAAAESPPSPVQIRKGEPPLFGSPVRQGSSPATGGPPK